MATAIFMEDTNSLIEQRRAKLKSLEAKGIFPFQNKFTPDAKCNDARSGFDSGALPEGHRVSVAGRITAHRDMGKSMFIDVRDQSGRIQCYAQKNTLGDEQFNIFTHLDLGDFVGVTGTLFRTKTGEPSIKLEAFTILAKSLRPPPAKWHGLEDTEIRYRQRYLDLIANDDVKKVFKQRSEIVHEIRQFFHARGYVEVETPAMQAIPGGAAAQPFKTFHNALGCEFYLRIALELYHKRLLVGGIDKLFEIGKNFRNEGLSRRHNPEFTMLEAYCAFGDYATMMETVESLITTVAQAIHRTLKVPKGFNIDKGRADISSLFKAIDKDFLQQLPNEVIKSNLSGDELAKAQSEIKNAFQAVNDLFNNLRTEIDTAIRPEFWEVAGQISTALENLFQKISELAQHFPNRYDENGRRLSDLKMHTIMLKNFSKLQIIDLTPPWRRVKYKDLIRERISSDWFEISSAERRQRAHDMGAEIGKEFEDFEVSNAVFSKFIEPKLDNPTFVTHLPKELVPLAKISPDDPNSVEVFECCINGQEISPGYTEQNDPIAQRTTLEHQAGGEQQKLDEDFLIALEHGMPPAGGIGIGIDRLCMMLLGQENIRDVILFPQLKPK
jgi:lysyl-tRNA synthetase class 2